MEHQDFPVAGFEFMNEPATTEQKDIITKLAERKGFPLDPKGAWPDPFTKWDAYGMIKSLEDLPDPEPSPLSESAGPRTQDAP